MQPELREQRGQESLQHELRIESPVSGSTRMGTQRPEAGGGQRPAFKGSQEPSLRGCHVFTQWARGRSEVWSGVQIILSCQ